MYDIVIVGAGVIGAFVARELSRYDLKTLVIEKEKEVANGVTKANTSIVHSGYSPKAGTIKSVLNGEAMEIFPQICMELNVPYKKTGSLLIALTEDSVDSVYEKYKRGIKNGVTNLRILNKEEILEIEPSLSQDIVLGLYSPDTGVVDNWQLCIGACENAFQNGVKFKLNEEVLNIGKTDNIFQIHTNKAEYKSKILINCGGLFADELNNMICTNKIKIKPKKGQYFILDKNNDIKVSNIIFLAKPESNKKLKGMIIAPTINGNIIIGPSSQDTKDKKDLNTTIEGLENIENISKRIIPGLDFSKNIKTFAALRPKLDLRDDEEDDFIIEEDVLVKGFINVAGIKSPGLTCAPSIGIMVANIVKDTLGDVQENEDFNPYREINRLSEDYLYGKIVCKCENISEGEIIDAVKRNFGANTVKGIKMRTMAGMGTCQGGFCTARIMEIISRELNKPIEEIL